MADLSSDVSISHGSLAACSARSMIALMTLLAFVMREHHGAEHFLFGQLLGFGFDHHHRVVGGGDDQVETAFRRALSDSARVEHVFAIDEADAAAPIGPMKGTPGNGQRGRSGDHRNDIGLGLAIIATGPGRSR